MVCERGRDTQSDGDLGGTHFYVVRLLLCYFARFVIFFLSISLSLSPSLFLPFSLSLSFLLFLSFSLSWVTTCHPLKRHKGTMYKILCIYMRMREFYPFSCMYIGRLVGRSGGRCQYHHQASSPRKYMCIMGSSSQTTRMISIQRILSQLPTVTAVFQRNNSTLGNESHIRDEKIVYSNTFSPLHVLHASLFPSCFKRMFSPLLPRLPIV